jgi:AcrR family transcriptional regulator
MSRFRYRFILHQVYAYYAKHGDLNWRDLAKSTKVSTRTLRVYFGSTEKLYQLLVEYHIKYLENYYKKLWNIVAKHEEFPFELLFYMILRHKVCYLFTDKASLYNLDGRGDEIIQLHLKHIAKSMVMREVKDSEKIDPYLVFRQLILPLENSRNNKEFFDYMIKFFLK